MQIYVLAGCSVGSRKPLINELSFTLFYMFKLFLMASAENEELVECLQWT